MRILLVHQHAYLPEHAGSTRHYSLAKEWVRRGHEVTIVASSFLHATRQEATRPQAAEGCCQWVDGIRFCWIRTPPSQGLGGPVRRCRPTPG